VVAPGKNDLGLFEWFSNQGTMSGRLVISLANEAKLNDSDAQILYFEDAQCFSLSELYDIDISRRRLLKLSISAETMNIDGITYQRI